MTYIVVTNDDGVFAPGILALATALQELGRVQVAAPATNQSASGHKITLFQDIPVEHTQLSNGIPALSVSGSPADCIQLSALEVIDWPPDIVISGINRGENMGQDITYSGTVTAALEACINGIPAIAVSLSDRFADDVEEYATAAKVAVNVTRHVLQNKLPPFTILNINVPAGDVKGLRLTRQGIRKYNDALELNGNIARVVGDPPSGDVNQIGTDIWAVHHGYASLTPIHLDMTAHRFLADLAAWDIRL